MLHIAQKIAPPRILQYPVGFWSIWEIATFLDPGFHETKQEEFDGDIKDRIKSTYIIKRHIRIGILLCGRDIA